MSGGPIAIIQRCWSSSSTSFPTSGAVGDDTNSNTDNSLFPLKAAVTGVLVGLLVNHLFGFGEILWKEASWMFFIFLLVYTLCLFILVPQLQWRQGSTSTVHFSPTIPNGITRLRSYLAFFPITHVINSSELRVDGRFGLESLSRNTLPGDVDENGMSIRVSAQMDMAIDAIVAEYVTPWYTKISDDRSFLDQSKAIIQAVFVKFGEKLRQVDRNDFAKEAIQIIHVHWKEYADSINRSSQSSNGNGDDVSKQFKFVHPFLPDAKEVSRRYQYLVGRALEELQIPELNSFVMCQFLAGILVKNFILYYMEMVSQPSWINGNLMSLLAASGSISVDLTGSSSQNSSSPASPLPDPSPKGISLFSEGEDGIECASSLCASSTADSTPTKKSRSSSGRSASGSGSQDEWVGKGEPFVQNQPQEMKHVFHNMSSSIEEGSSSISDMKTESESGAGLAERRFHSKTESNGSSSSVATTSSIFSYTTEAVMVSKRPKDLTPLNRASSLRTLSTALGSVMHATAFPLLPSECYTDENNLNLPKYTTTQQPRGVSTKLEEISESEIFQEQDDEREVMKNECEIYDDSDQGKRSSENDDEPKPEDHDEEEGKESPSSSSGNKSMTSSHYYSFDEASKPKAASTSFFEGSTLSLDGAMDNRNKQSGRDQLLLCSHEYKHSSESGVSIGKSTRSPVYEEPEDFAASIAKLRSLLEQKERKSSIPPMSAPPLDDSQGDVFEPPSSPGTVSDTKLWSDGSVIASQSIPQISETCASESHTTPSSTSSMDNSKASSRFSFTEAIIPSETDSTIIDPIDKTNYDDPVPEIKCCFRNITIPKVENSADAGGQYIFYCIQYEGVYYDEKEEGQPQKLVYRTTTIKRRFKEFLTLQAHLEENAACKPHLKGIKTPTRWLNVSLTKSDATVAHQRRAMLEKYLQQLCYHPIIGFCQEVLIFMAYGEDGFCSFEVGDPKDLLTHRLDKLARKFTGVINSLKDALPSFELDLSPAPNTPKSGGITPCDLKAESSFTPFSFQDKFEPLEEHDKALTLESPWINKFSAAWTPSNAESTKESLTEKHDQLPPDSPAFTEREVEEGKIFSTYPLAAAVTQLLCDVLWLPQYRPHPASVATFMSISGKSLENYVLETMDIFLSEEAILGYLEWLTISINNGQSDTDSSRYDTSNEYYSEQDLKNIVKRRIPAWVRWMWGRSRLDLTIDRITGLFQNSLVNHDLVLSLCELLFSKIVTIEDHHAE